MFDRLVDLTEPICQRIDRQKSSMLLFDTSGIKAWVTENNPKYANRITKQLKAYRKANRLGDSYGSMPPHVASNPVISRCISTDISAMLTTLASSQTGLASSGTSPFITGTFLKSIWTLSSKKIQLPGRG